MQTALVALSLVLFCATGLRAEENWYRTDKVVAHDADTIKCDVIFPWGVTLRGQSVRLAGVDAWEITKQRQTVKVTDAEVAKGKKALAEFNELRAKGRLELQPLTYEGTDSVYGRIEARWRIVTEKEIIDVAKWVKANDHERK